MRPHMRSTRDAGGPDSLERAKPSLEGAKPSLEGAKPSSGVRRLLPAALAVLASAVSLGTIGCGDGALEIDYSGPTAEWRH